MEDTRGVNEGHRRSAAVNRNLTHDQRKLRDQHRLTARSLDGMQQLPGRSLWLIVHGWTCGVGGDHTDQAHPVHPKQEEFHA